MANKVQLEGIIKLIDVELDPAIYQKISRATGALPATFGGITSRAGAAGTAVNNLANATKRVNQQLSFGEVFANKFLQRMTQFAILLPIFSTLNKALQGGVKFLADFESELINIQRVDPKNLTSRMGEIADTALDISANFGASAVEVAKSIRTFVQAGDSIEQAMDKARVATLATQTSTINLAQAQQLLINVSKQFRDEGVANIDVIDKLTKVADTSASDVSDIAEAFVTGGNAISFATKSFDSAIAIVAALREQTRKSGAEIGTFLKTLSARILAAGESQSALEQLGVTVSDQAGNLKPLMEILRDTKVAFDNLSEAEQANAAKSIAGVRQFEGFLAIMQSLDRAQDLTATSAGAQGESMKRLSIVQEKLSLQTEQMVGELQKLAEAFGEAGVLDFFKEAVKGATAFTQGLTEIVSVAKTLGVAIAPLLAIGGLKLGQKAFGFGGQAIRNTLGIPRPAQGGALGGAPGQQAVGYNPLYASSLQGGTTLQHFAHFSTMSLNPALQSTQSAQQAAQQRDIKLRQQQNDAMKEAAVRFVGFTAAAAGLNQVTRILEDSLKNVTGPTKAYAHALINVTSSLSTGAQVASIYGVKMGLTTAVIELGIKSLIDIAGTVKEELNARKELAAFEQKAKGGRALGKAAAGELGISGTDLTKQINDVFKNALGKSGGLTTGDFSTRIQAQLKSVFEAIDPNKNPELKDLKNLDLADIFGNKDFFKAVGNADESLKHLNKAIADNAPVSRLLAAYEADMFEQAKKAGVSIKELSDGLATLAQVKAVDKLRQSENEVSKLLQERQDINRTDIPLFESEIDSLKRRAEATKSFLDVAGAAKTDLLKVAAVNPQELGFVGQGASGRAYDFLEKVQDAFSKAGQGGEFQLTKFLDDLQKTKTGNIKDAAEALEKIGVETQNITDDQIKRQVEAARHFVELMTNGLKETIAKEKILKELRDASSKQAAEYAKIDLANIAGSVEALNRAQLALINLGVNANLTASDLDRVSKLTDQDFTDIINNTGNFSEGLRDLIKTTGGTEIQRAQQAARISADSLAKEMQILNDKIKEVKGQLGNIHGGFNQITGKSQIQLTEELGRLENDRKSLELQGVHDSIKANLDLLKARRDADREAVRGAQELKKALDSLDAAQLKLSQGLEDSKKSFNEFAQQQEQSLLSEDAQAQSKLKESEQGVLESTKSLEASYRSLKDAVLAFNDTMANAQVEVGLLSIQTKNLGGSSDNIASRISSLNKIFNDAMKDANISLRERLDLEKQLADNTLQFLKQAQDQIVSAGLNVFGQSAQQNSDLAKGIAGLQYAADQLGGSFEKFTALNPQQLDTIGKGLLALPQTLRQQMLDALHSLPSTTKIGGFSPEQLQTALGQVGTGVSAQEGLPAISDILKEEKEQLQKIQDTTTKQAELQINQVAAALQQVENSKVQLEQAKVMEERAKEDAVATREKILEQTAVIQEAADQREKLTAQILQATDSSAIRQIEAQARNFASQEPLFTDISNKLVELINSVGSFKDAQLNALESLANLQTQQQESGLAGYEAPPNAARGFIPHFAGGRLSSGEVVGLLRAASLEKSAMPPGAGLAVANTSEMIIPTRSKGYIPNFALGNSGNVGSPIAAGIDAIKGINQTVAAAIASSVTKSLNLLQTGNSATGGDINRLTLEKLDKILSTLQELSVSSSNINATLSAANTPTAPTQQAAAVPTKIDVSVNGQNTVTVNGLDQLKTGLSDAIKKAQDDHAEKVTAPLNEAIQQIYTALKERGLLSAFGGPR